MMDRQNRTHICSVLFVDIVEYSAKRDAEQIGLKGRLNSLLNEVLRDVALNDRVVLDTGDGAAIGFLGDPEEALFAALSLRDGAAACSESPEAMALRMGINLGPVRLVKDVNGQRNFIGDGINVAQRIMTYAAPSQILVSRSYYEVLSRLSQEFAHLFQYEGARVDKHVREHEVYAVVTGDAALKHRDLAGESLSSEGRTGAGSSALFARAGAMVKDRLRGRGKAGLVLAALVALGAAGAMLHVRRGPSAVAPEAPKTIAASRPSRTGNSLLSATSPGAGPPTPSHSQTQAAAASSVVKEAPPQPLAKHATPAPLAVLRFAITPWGEIFVDGKRRGASPPLRELKLAPGNHRIEVRNSAFPTHVVTFDLEPGTRTEIRYVFK